MASRGFNYVVVAWLTDASFIALNIGIKEALQVLLIKILYNATNEITVKIEGNAKLLGLESGSSDSHEDYKSNSRKAMNGKLLTYVQSVKNTSVQVTLQSPNLQTKTLQLNR